MQRTDDIENNQDVLKRIVSLLFALAGLADRAAGLPLPVRRVVLWFLHRAEIVAWDMVVVEAHDRGIVPALPAEASDRGRTETSDAFQLAWCLRMLAFALSKLLMQARRLVLSLSDVGVRAAGLRSGHNQGTTPLLPEMVPP